MIEHNITIGVSEELSKPDLISFYNCVNETVASGLVTSVTVDAKAVLVVKQKEGNDIQYVIPLTRDLTEKEIDDLVAALSAACSFDFDLSASRTVPDYEIETTVKLDHDPLMAMCAAWAKKKHDEWMKGKVDAGWRYGTAVSQTNMTHPLIRSWEELPQEHKVIDVSQVQEVLDLLKAQGYCLVRSQDLDVLLNNF